MDYTKFIRSSNKKTPFKLNYESPLIEESMSVLQQFNEIQTLLSNYFKTNSSIDLDTTYEILLEDKNTFTSKLSTFLKSNYFPKSHLLLFQSILSIINRRFEDLAMQYKLIKQKAFKQTRRLQLFNFNKLTFTKGQKENNRLLNDIKKSEGNVKKSKSFIDTSYVDGSGSE